MKPKQVRASVHHAIAITGGHVDWRNPTPPTWDGRMWHFARLQSEGDVLHEVAHWVISPAAARALPNYGLGTDPDDGPFTEQNLLPFLSEKTIFEKARQLGRIAPDRLLDILEEKAAREEQLAAVVTIVLMRACGLPWAERMRQTFRAATPELFWGLVVELAQRGVDLTNPLAPFVGAKAGAA